MAKKANILILVSLFFATALVAYAFSEPQSTSLNLSITGALNVGVATESKIGGLGINSGKGFDGLIIYDFNSPGSEKFGIGTNNPLEKLHLIGNWNTTGIIKPSGLTGNTDDQLINVNGQQMKWGNVAWLNIQRIDIIQSGVCTQVWPDCPAGWTKYSDEISDSSCPAYGDGTYSGYGAVRICYQNF